MLKKTIWDNFLRNTELFAQRIVTKLSKIWVSDPGSEIRDPEKNIPDPGSKGQKGTESRIRIRNTELSFSNIASSVVLKFETINRKLYKNLRYA
jgi:hypothetical protein